MIMGLSKSQSAGQILLKAKKIGIIRTDRLGDMILTLPMFGVLREICPAAELFLFSKNYVKPLMYGDNAIHSTLFCDTDSELKQALMQTGCDVLFYPRPRFSEAFYGIQSKARLRIGSAYRYYSPFVFNVRIQDHRSTAQHHEAEYNIRMIQHIIHPLGIHHKPVSLQRPNINPESAQFVKEYLQKAGLSAYQNYMIIHPGSGGSARDIAPQMMGAAAAQIAKSLGINIIITGTAAEADKCWQAHSICPEAYNFCGKLDLWQMIALIDRAGLLLANSTGILHLAAALGIPVLGFYPNSPAISAARWGPYSPVSCVLTPPLSKGPEADDMSLIPLDEIVKSGINLYNSWNRV
jgi:ADP-heptose:LPS heptosyltransferase